MTILGALVQALGRGQNLYDYGSAAGPTSYLVGTGVGFTSLIGTALDWDVWTDDQTVLRANAVIYALVNTRSGAALKSLVYTFTTLANSAAIVWAEAANAGNYAALTWRYRAVGV